MSMTALAIDYVDKKTEHTFHLPISVFKKPTNSAEYSKLEKVLDKLIDEVRDNEKHPLSIVMQIIGENLEQYDNEHYFVVNVFNKAEVVHFMHRKIATAAQKKNKKHAATIEELLSSNEIKILIAEFVIFIRSSTLLTSYTPCLVSTETAVETQNAYYRQLLITKISDLAICKTEKWNKNVVKYPVQRLLNLLILSKHKNDEWALQYLAHFFFKPYIESTFLL